MQHLHTLTLSGLLACGVALPLQAQVLVGSNQSQTTLAPFALNSKTAKRLSPKGTRLRSDFTASQQEYFVVEFSGILSAETEALVMQEARILSYLPERMYVLTAPKAETAAQNIQQALQTANAAQHVLNAGTLPLQFKLHASLLGALEKGEALNGVAASSGVVVAVYDKSDRTALERTLDSWGVHYELTPYEEVHIDRPTTELVAQLAALNYVCYISPKADPVAEKSLVLSDTTQKPVAQAISMNWITQPNRVQKVNYDFKGSIGRGTTFANWETFGKEYIWKLGTYGRNVPSLAGDSENDHGTFCGLIATGANNINEYEGMGMAPGAQIIAMNEHKNGWGVHQNGVIGALDHGYFPLVANHSVGWLHNVNKDNTTADIYDNSAALVDDIINKRNNFVITYSSGNHAYGTHTYRSFDNYSEVDYGRITGDIKTNKNAFCVHSTLYPGVDITWANFGPTFDGRMKPDISAQGSGGTSFASPGVAGMTLILHEEFRKAFPNEAAHMDVVKAVILNTATDVKTYANGVEEGRGIDYRTGFGEINAPAAVEAIAQKNVSFKNTITHGVTKTEKLNVPAGQTELRIMLYWNDPAATPGTSKALVNDLDLEVVTPSGKVILPWTLNPSAATVSKPATRSVNRRDNVEQVVLTAATAGETLEAGEYTIRIKGTAVTRGPQRYVTTWQMRERSIKWTSIPEGFRLAPGQQVILSWDMTLSEAEDQQALNYGKGKITPRLYYRTSPTEAWKTATAAQGLQYTSNVEPKNVFGALHGKNFFVWNVPSNMPSTSQLQFRVECEGLEAISENAHVGEALTTRPRILARTPEKVKLSWEAAKHTSKGKYLIYALYDKYMTLVDSVDMPTTTKEINAPEGVKWTDDQLFAVAVFNADSRVKGQRSLPAGLNPFDVESTDAADLWQNEYTLCVGDVQTLRTNNLEGTVQWYKDKTPIAAPRGSERSLNIQHHEVGDYHYSISNAAGEVLFTSPSTKIAFSGVELNDTAQWGEYTWKGYAFNKPAGAVDNLPLLTDGLSLYGTFSLNKLSFNSHTDLFKWNDQKVSNIANYRGCPTANDHTKTVVVMKRKGFTPGYYSFIFKRASGIAQVFIYDKEGKRIKAYTSPVNSYEQTSGNSLMSVKLDENSKVEIHWTGNHLNLQTTMSPTGPSASVIPGRLSNRPALWINPANINTDEGTALLRLHDSYPSGEVYTATTNTGAVYKDGVSNFNPVLVFNGDTRYDGGTRNHFTGNSTVDFVVMNARRTAGEERILSLGEANGDDLSHAERYALLLNKSGYYSFERGGNYIYQNKAGAGKMQIVTYRQTPTTISMALNGETNIGSKTVSQGNLSLSHVAIGASLRNSNFITGQLAELLHYDGGLTPDNENKVRTYLAIKHGITLDHDYKIANLTLYPVKSSAYKYQIAALAMDKNSMLEQKQSRGHLSNGAAAQLLMSIGNLAASNRENTANFKADRTYYVLAANQGNVHPTAYTTEDKSRLTYHLRSTLPTTNSVADTLSFYFPLGSITRANLTAYLEVSNTEFAATGQTEGATLLPLTNYNLGATNYLRAQYQPTTANTYLRLVWKATPTAIEQVEMSDQSAVSYDAATHNLHVRVDKLKNVDIIDLQGRILRAGERLNQGVLLLSGVPVGTYVLRIHKTDGTSQQVKFQIEK